MEHQDFSWTTKRAHAYTFVLTVVMVLGLSTCVLRLAGVLPDSAALRALLLLSLAMALVTLVVRVWREVGGAASFRQRENPPSDDGR